MKTMVVIPALNPDSNLIGYVEEVLSNDVCEVLVVNDGSDSDRHSVFDALERSEGCTVLHHSVNRGKGAAIKTAVSYLVSNRDDVEGLVTADADGQHGVQDVLRLIDELEKDQDSLILGVRTFDEKTPQRSRMGNKISAKTLQLLYGIKLNDTQTGLRAISKKYFNWMLSLSGNRYEYELNMLIYSKNIGLNLSSVPIQTLYFNNNAGSHFKTVRDGGTVMLHMFKGVVEYIGNSLISAFIDISVFTILFYLSDSFLTATVGTTFSAVTARVISSVVDFKLNRRTFSGKHIVSQRAYVKYYILWITQLSISTAMVNLMNIYFGALQTVMKPIIDFALAVISYKVQLHWVFKAKSDTAPANFNEIIDRIKRFQLYNRLLRAPEKRRAKMETGYR